jgi:DNA primase
VQLLMKNEMEKLRLVTDPTEQDRVLQVIFSLKSYEKQIGDLLGIVVNK